ncbi:MAG: heavy metal-responsive transcriptional regulator [Gammaproteobacteria bacterium CG11_big_fil_rev_8_21_14_0_20_46_22]|nr:MAG: heavy metal-responsive transcriptional regulator [Gammaproteobacteria bacterium CG12_big_fil_rev_8_21_14_0_65_46_12]PIR11817.1 MAG: heavy metal-responsive transcriptional regulator [Gammaproteobacteria bacterium CG11_big_fil_rev_8_21_14_0_20_46_22]
MNDLTIGQVAKLANVSADTIRLYERYGLLVEPKRAANGYRQYTQDTVQRLTFILRAKTMGFTLNEIRELLALQPLSTQSCKEAKRQANAKLQSVKDKLTELKRLERALSQLIQACDIHSPKAPCPILMAFAKNFGGSHEKPKKHEKQSA